ncbi:hypothetical protein Nepgr_032426 [Nepenthes gracilis]|uniref:PUM-HD domain-containing protein n=1 Tax=Nepenthes gracilis TaxID=150966 RepID=A0AAD3Y615_NEPGR|nr:hypothetical protein Nepgr_032426 [Nepenthes gracilis]
MESDFGVRSIDCGEELRKDLSLLLKEQRRQEANEKEGSLDIFRSGSAPPIVDSSMSALGGSLNHPFDVWASPSGANKLQMSEEELRSDPAYANYYYSNMNLNPRLPPPMLSKEDWRFAQRLSNGGAVGSVLGGIGDRRRISRGDDGGDIKSFIKQSGFDGKKEENGDDLRKAQHEWSGDGLIGLPGLGLGGRQKSIAEIIQDDLNHATSISRSLSHPASRNVFDENIATSECQVAQLQHEISSIDALSTSVNVHGMSSSQNTSASASLSYASALGASSLRSTMPDPQLLARVHSPRIPTAVDGRGNSMDERNANGPISSADVVAAFSGMNLSADHSIDDQKHLRSHFSDHHIKKKLFNLQDDHNHMKQNLYLKTAESGPYHENSIPHLAKASSSFVGKNIGYSVDRNNYYIQPDGLVKHCKPSGASLPSNYRAVGSPSSAIPSYNLSEHNINPALARMMAAPLGGNNFTLLAENASIDCSELGGGFASGMNLMAAAAAAELQTFSRLGNHSAGTGLHLPIVDSLYHQYLRSPEYAAAQVAAINDPARGNSYMDLLALQKGYLGTVLSHQKSEGGGPYVGKIGDLNHGYYGNQAFGIGMGYTGRPLMSSLIPDSPVACGGPMSHGDRNMHLPSGMRSLAAGVMGTWCSDVGGAVDQSFGSSLLDEFKSNKIRCFELSEIAGHVVEFSADQYGSRFIQQKLETATMEEKNMVFHEIIPQALTLMTDVFGNYVIQKFFEHGTTFQIRELAGKLTGHVLTLSLQMYGCRVIQKAIEVVDLDQQKEMVMELDGHIMRCVRDQNGNHVIQKCIECIPEDSIQFIISTFYDEVVTLSTHPYGCRVIQRVLEYCRYPKTQHIVMDEIMQSVCMLAQDQYGNYVVQHVLEHGKPHERTAIISKLTGKIVQMSQQKFASNVIEKCLTFGDPVERRTMVNEMLGSTEENEPLQVMMKDQFANYVVQKVLETCEDNQLELVLCRIKIHLNALKKYTYGKHIVARVEKLVAAGERRIGAQSAYAVSTV